MKGLCVVAVAPLRLEASHRSEMVSQLLFGEIVEIIAKDGDFFQVNTVYDNYSGWCQAIQIVLIDFDVLPNRVLAEEWVSKININGQFAFIPMGADLSMLEENKARAGELFFEYDSNVVDTNASIWNEENIKQVAYKYFNTPYLWGGRSVFGIDCSGFTQMVYKFFNIKLLRDASQQATQGDGVGFLQEVKTGDLAFFDNDEGKIVHVGLMLDSKSIIHASGKVRIDGIDNMGIVNLDSGIRTHKLRLIKRIVDY